ncbi:carbohydrate ABC transporter membrane protein 2, CUT1 family (TC 3.A.1.1.-) [Andreprevotia lacus DSM 23236]|jgi:putative chitobiose transport system permease protein|uniref:sn-glycerol-3-phosphate transport system permease protein UgpE n=1 Tax=Andreprevotia lacus DSM 23236 TaxID=1121001 RepID=A0A1W1XZ50_9NEIS|nr:carbohydrate ABC transporter permease [Andreprevotia lacus]SMC29193.1 carbohydrate ABC transporter membrane protein 2, CUT1 family (TC 3.A.1.1.-) [Andreprevotia lacus DSM 23236]
MMRRDLMQRGWLLLRYAALLLLTVVAVFPFLWALLIAVSAQGTDAAALYGGANSPFTRPGTGVMLAGLQAQLDRFHFTPFWLLRVFDAMPFTDYLGNSLQLALETVAGVLLLSIPCGYALAQHDFAGKRWLFLALMATLMLPMEVNLVPNFITSARLGLLDTHAAAVLPNIAAALGVFIMRQAFLRLPTEMLDAARVDGASEWQLLWRIAMPLTLPAVSTLAIFSFVLAWNDYLWPAVVLSDRAKLPLAVGIFNDLTGPFATSANLAMAAVVLAIAPVLAGFALTQRLFFRLN